MSRPADGDESGRERLNRYVVVGTLIAVVAFVGVAVWSALPQDRPSASGASSTSAAVDDGFWFVDLGTVGMPSARIGERYFFNFTSIGNLSDGPLTVLRLEFPDLPAGLRVTRVGLRSEAEEVVAGGSSGEEWPAGVMPLPKVIVPVKGDVDDPLEDERFFTVFVEVELLAEGKWAMGRMDLTYLIGDVERTRTVAFDVGNVCTTKHPEPCVPGLGL